MPNQPITISELSSLHLEGRPFVQEQGQSLTRGFVAGFHADDETWRLNARDVEYFSGSRMEWLSDPDDTYGGNLESHASFYRDSDTDMIELNCYGVVVYVGPACDSPWTEITWPQTDIEPIGLNIDGHQG